MITKERRTYTIKDVEVRESGTSPDEVTFVGYAVVFGAVSHDLGVFRETFKAGAFTDVLAGDPDVHLVINHDQARVLARTTSGTLDLTEDQKGLRVWAKLDKRDPDVQSLIVKMERGDVDQMSLMFIPGEEMWDHDKETPLRTIVKVEELFEVTVCPQGAYPQTEAELRSIVMNAQEEGLLEAPVAEAEDPQGEEVSRKGTRNLALVKLQTRARVALTTQGKEDGY